MDDLGAVVLDEGTDHTKTCQTEVLKWPCFAHSVQERVEEKRDVGWMICIEKKKNFFFFVEKRLGTIQEQWARVVMRCDGLEQRKGVAYAVGGVSRKTRRR